MFPDYRMPPRTQGILEPRERVYCASAHPPVQNARGPRWNLYTTLLVRASFQGYSSVKLYSVRCAQIRMDRAVGCTCCCLWVAFSIWLSLISRTRTSRTKLIVTLMLLAFQAAHNSSMVQKLLLARSLLALVSLIPCRMV